MLRLMRFSLGFGVVYLACLIGGALVPVTVRGATGPLYDLHVTWGDSYLTPGDSNPASAEGQFVLQARNLGDAPGAEQALRLLDELPAGLTATAVSWSEGTHDYSSDCSGLGSRLISCTLPAPLVPKLVSAPGATPGEFSPQPSGHLPTLYIDVSVSPNVLAPRQGLAEGTNRAALAGGGAPAALKLSQAVPFARAPAPFGLAPGSFYADALTAPYPLGKGDRQAGDHPFELRLALDISARTGSNENPGDHSRYVTSNGSLRSVQFTLPPGFIGNPQAVPRCPIADFAQQGAAPDSTLCPPDTQVGYLDLAVADGTANYARGGLENANGAFNRIPLYNVAPPKGAPADFAFSVGGFVLGHLYPSLDPGRGYATKIVMPNLSSLFTVRGVEATIWGVPADSAHDRFRYRLAPDADGNVLGAGWGSVPIRPLLTEPFDCGEANGGARISVDSYQHPEVFTAPTESPDPVDVEGCEDPRIHFESQVSLVPTSPAPVGPTGLSLHIRVPPPDDEAESAMQLYAANGSPQGVGMPPLRSAALTLPAGVSISPTVAQGLAGCSSTQVALGTDRPIACPEASRIGSASVTTSILPEPLTGGIYLATPNDNPFDSLLAAYLVVEAQGGLVKLPVRFDLDPQSGRITASLADLPQQPFTQISLDFKGGPSGVLAMPPACGRYVTGYALTSWANSEPLIGTSPFIVDQGCDQQRAFHPDLTAGTFANSAGTSSPLALDLRRADGEPDLSRLDLILPPGVAADLAAVGVCADALAASGDCPAASRIGSAAVAVGAGPAPLWLPQPAGSPASVYLAGPYRGAPYSLAIVLPVRAGPFDLGTVVERAAISLDPHSAQLSANLDPLPQILQGIPLDYRELRLVIDRPGFIRNPTSCAAQQVSGIATSVDDATAALSNGFSASGCGALPFRPRLSLNLRGGLARNAHPALRAVLRSGPGAANLAAAAFTLPPGELLDFHRLDGLCARGLPPERCPAASRAGYARIYSPLLAAPLEGSIYLREPSKRLPDVLADLRGDGFRLILHGHTAAPGGRLRLSFPTLPDVPVSRAVVTLAGGHRGILANSESLCRHARRANATFRAHSGKRLRLRPRLRLHGRCK